VVVLVEREEGDMDAIRGTLPGASVSAVFTRPSSKRSARRSGEMRETIERRRR
jgi:hypothetical protein